MNWLDLISQEKQKLYFKQILSFLEAEKEQGKIIFPAEEDVFNAFKLTEFDLRFQLIQYIMGREPEGG